MNSTSWRRYAIIEAPSILGLRPSGVERLPQRLLEEGLAEHIGARIADRLTTPPYDSVPDAETQTLNAHQIAAWTPQLADSVGGVFDSGDFPLVLGGDCSIVLGSMLALRRRGRYGLLYIDGHADFYQPEVNPNGEAASMDLAFVTGHGPSLLTDIEHRKPLVREEDVFLFSYRDAEEQAAYHSQPIPPTLRSLDLADVRRLGIQQAAHLAVDHLTRTELDGFFIHLDTDSLNDSIMPAVDYRLADGLSWQELITLLRIALATGRACGMEVSIYNPSLDADRSIGRSLVEALSQALGTKVPVH